MIKPSQQLKNYFIPTWDHIARVVALELPDSHPFQLGKVARISSLPL